MSRLTPRIERLEARNVGEAQRAARIVEDAHHVGDTLKALAARLDDKARDIDAPGWAGFSPAQQVAWAMRFAGWPMEAAICNLFPEAL